MSLESIANALRGTAAAFERKPSLGFGDDSTAAVSWSGGLRFEAEHPSGNRIVTDLNERLGGAGGQVTPGWLLRAGVGSCTASCIVLAAAVEGIELDCLEIRVDSRSDTRGVLGLSERGGERVDAAARDYRMSVTIGARNASPERLRALVAEGQRRSPIYLSLVEARPVAVDITVVER